MSHDVTNPSNVQWLEKLRKEYFDSKFSQKSALDLKIKHFLKLPTLAPVEMRILKNLLDQKVFHNKWQIEKDQLLTKCSTNKRKGTSSYVENETQIKANKMFNLLTDDKEETTKNIEDNHERDSITETESKTSDKFFMKESMSQTPEKRKTLLLKFGIKTPSPIIKLSKVTNEEMKCFSIAVHLWAEVTYGGTGILQKLRLRKKHFQEILSFAGPGTRYNLIKGRSVIQYECLWRNSAKSQNFFRGHPESGFENDFKLHSASSPFCPFEHCSTGIIRPMNPLEMDIVLMTPKRSQKVSSSRKLFTRNKENANEICVTDSNKKRIQSEVTETHLENESMPVESTVAPNDDYEIKISPTKQELTLKKRKLLKEIQQVTQKLGKYKHKEEVHQPYIITTIKCKTENCTKEFSTMSGLIKHQQSQHLEGDTEKNLEICKICGKEVVYIEKHIKNAHKNALSDEICEVCKQTVKKVDMKKHRGNCICCPSCGKQEKKKIRLLKHISICLKVKKISPVRNEPLDLTSPMKKVADNKSQIGEHNKDAIKIKIQEIDRTTKSSLIHPNDQDFGKSYYCSIPEKNNNELVKIKENSSGIAEENIVPLLDASYTEDPVYKKRMKFPFDIEGEEEYLSEFEEHDAKEDTLKRRQNKDKLEIRLRQIDGIINTAKKGDDEIINKFKLFMQMTTNGENNEDAIEPSTVGIYTRSVQNDILQAFHKLFVPFDSHWLLDCTTPKECTFEGEQRVFVSPNEPIYLTARVLRKAMEKYRTGESGQQRATLMAASVQFMNFIELQFNNKLNVYGRKPLDSVISYHNGVKSFIDGTKIWKTCNKDKKKKMRNNKILKEYENPNYEAEVLNRYKKYLKSQKRLSQIRKILYFASEEDKKPSDKEFTELGNIVMGEVITSTGCRPVVVYRLPVGGYVGKKPGFNPRRITPEDCEIDEEYNDKKTYRRINPNLPPRQLACKHQLENKTAICPENCDKRCEPEGFNIYCDWDKTRNTNGPSYLHLAKPIKDILDLYDIIKTKFFRGRKPTNTFDEHWLDKENTSFFLNSSGSQFQAVDLKHLSEALGIDVTAYSFRQIVSTWAQSHESEEIRKAEGEALQHSLRVAVDHYLQNKQLQPQTLTQTYIEEECILPEHLREEIKKTEIKTKEKILATEEKRQKQQHKALLRKSEANRKLQMENKLLGPTQRVLGVDRKYFKEIVEEITGENIEITLKERKPLSWRNFIVRIVCSTTGEKGEDLRNTWVKIYRGDLQWGVRDVRFRAKEKGWPRMDSNSYMQKKDRNSWIASSILRSLKSELKVKEKKNYVKLMNK